MYNKLSKSSVEINLAYTEYLLNHIKNNVNINVNTAETIILRAKVSFTTWTELCMWSKNWY